MQLSNSSLLCVSMAIWSCWPAQHACAVPSPYSPDAWVRGNTANTSYFGWNLFETDGPPNLGSLWILDDSTPDLGNAITAGSTRIYQGTDGFSDPSPNLVGHVSSTQNYYSLDETFDAKITGLPPSAGGGGFTTVVLQLHSTVGGDSIDDLVFTMVDMGPAVWTLQKHLTGVNAQGLGFHWAEWTIAAAGPFFRIEITSALAHRPVDSFEIDTYWSPTGPVVNAITAVPEPASWLLAAWGGLVLLRAIETRSGRGRTRICDLLHVKQAL